MDEFDLPEEELLPQQQTILGEELPPQSPEQEIAAIAGEPQAEREQSFGQAINQELAAVDEEPKGIIIQTPQPEPEGLTPEQSDRIDKIRGRVDRLTPWMDSEDRERYVAELAGQDDATISSVLAPFEAQAAKEAEAIDAEQTKARAQLKVAKKLQDEQAAKAAQIEKDLVALREREIEQSNEPINPDQYWDEKPTWKKVLAVIAAGLAGAMSATRGGPNTALQILDRQMERSIEKQKLQKQQQLQTTRGQISAYERELANYQDPQIAAAVVKAQMQTEVLKELEARRATTRNPQLLAAIDTMASEVAAARQKSQLQAAEWQQDRRLTEAKIAVEAGKAEKLGAEADKLARAGVGTRQVREADIVKSFAGTPLGNWTKGTAEGLKSKLDERFRGYYSAADRLHRIKQLYDRGASVVASGKSWGTWLDSADGQRLKSAYNDHVAQTIKELSGAAFSEAELDVRKIVLPLDDLITSKEAAEAGLEESLRSIAVQASGDARRQRGLKTHPQSLARLRREIMTTTAPGGVAPARVGDIKKLLNSEDPGAALEGLQAFQAEITDNPKGLEARRSENFKGTKRALKFIQENGTPAQVQAAKKAERVIDVKRISRMSFKELEKENRRRIKEKSK